jgi:predicted O-methyltransferase YrrM
MDFTTLAGLASGHAEARILQTAVSLGLFVALEDRPLDARTVALTLHTDVRATELLLNALVAMALLEKQGTFFSLNPTSSTYLIHSSNKYFGDMVLFESSLWDCWGALEKTIRSGNPARETKMYQEDSRETERFIYAMHSLVEARGDTEVLKEKLDLSGVTDLLDIGSGPGTYPIHFCRQYPDLRITIFDLPGTLKITERFVQASGFHNRLRLIPGDYRFDSIPGRYQLVFLSNIIHAESPETNAALVTKVYHCLEQSGKLVIKDHILDDNLTHPPVGALFSLLMLLTTGQGRCYSFSEVKRWLEATAFKNVVEISLPHPLTSSLVIGAKDEL